MHAREIEKVRQSSHANTNEITKLSFMHKENYKDIGDIKADINIIKNNHLSHIEIDVSELKTDMRWLKKFFFVVAGTSIGALITGLIQLLITKQIQIIWLLIQYNQIG